MAKVTPRSRELSGREEIREKLLDIFAEVERGYTDQWERTNDQIDFWEMYNATLSDKQFYHGNAKIFVPIVQNAVNARVTRFTNQMFPQSGRYVEATTENGDVPYEVMALAEHYIEKARLKTQIARPLIRNGDIEGQYNIYVSWRKIERHVVKRSTAPIEIEGIEMPDDDEVERYDSEVIDDEGPLIEVISDADVVVLPATADSIDDALEAGGSVTILRRWSKAAIKRMISDGEFVRSAGESVIESMKGANPSQGRDMAKVHVDAAGIKSRGKYLLGYETWTKLKVDGEMRICRAYYAGQTIILGCKLNPYWCDLIPLISCPAEKVNNAFKGVPPVASCQSLQYSANDAVNEGMDSATYSLLPIIMTDPLKNPKVGTMVLDLAAVWEVDPNSTKFASFPELWKSAFEIVASAKNEIYQNLSVNPSMMPQGTGSRSGKRNQAEIANEQQVDVLSTADAVGILEEGIFTPLVQRIIWYDHQFRDQDVTVKAFGQAGRQAEMQTVPPLQMNTAYYFKWYGVEQARAVQQMQQQIATMNVLRGIPPELLPNRKLDLVPIVERLVENTFGPRLAPKIFTDLRDELSVDPELENQLLEIGMVADVHPTDDDQQHLQVHMPLASNDPHGTVRAHIQAHQNQMGMKAKAQQGPPGAPGTPGGGQPGVAGVPQPGAQPAQPRGNMQPPGAVRPEAMPTAMPRKM